MRLAPQARAHVGRLGPARVAGGPEPIAVAPVQPELSGVALREAVAVGVKRAYPGTVEITAAAAITAGATIYGAADGKVSEVSSGTDKFGKALGAASGDGAVIESIMDD